MFIKLPVYPSSYKWSSDHSVKDMWIKTSTIVAVESHTWEKQGTINPSMSQNPKDRPEICIVRSGAGDMYCAMTADKCQKAVTAQLKKEAKEWSSVGAK